MTSETNSNCISAAAVALRLGVSRLHVYRLVREGDLPAGVVIRVGRRKLQFDRAMLESWIRSGGAGQRGRRTLDGPQTRGAGLKALLARNSATREQSE